MKNKDEIIRERKREKNIQMDKRSLGCAVIGKRVDEKKKKKIKRGWRVRG